MNVGIIGTGNMGRAIAGQLAGAGDVLIAGRNPETARDLVAEIGDGVTAASIEEALGADIVVSRSGTPARSSSRASTRPSSRARSSSITDTAVALSAGKVDGVSLDVFVASNHEQAKQEVMELVDAAGLRPLDAGELDNARLLERLTAFQIELNERYDLDLKVTFKLLSEAPVLAKVA